MVINPSHNQVSYAIFQDRRKASALQVKDYNNIGAKTTAPQSSSPTIREQTIINGPRPTEKEHRCSSYEKLTKRVNVANEGTSTAINVTPLTIP